MAEQPKGETGPRRSKDPHEINALEAPVGLVPRTFKAAYVAGAVTPFLLSSTYVAETPSLPMIDLALDKEQAVPIHLWGLLYEGWGPNLPDDGLSVFNQGYANRGPDNERKRIYASAVTPDLIATKYRDKITRFFDQLFADTNAGKPLMHEYYADYFDLYWDLHVGVTADAIPPEVREIGACFNAVIGFWFPTLQVVHDKYMRVRELRQTLKDWIDVRVQAVLDGAVAEPDRTLVYYWLKNSERSEYFRRKDIVFECFHNFLALSQWGNMAYNTMKRLEPAEGEAAVRSWFERTMTSGPDTADGSPFTPLDRFVMELFRWISPNKGSLSKMVRQRDMLSPEFSGIVTPHEPTSHAPRHWSNPDEFDPDRYKAAPTSVDNDEGKSKAAGLAQCPFPKKSFAVKDGRRAELTNSAFGAVYPVIDGRPYPVCDAAGYAPFGFGYRRCPGEHLTVEFIKEMLRKTWRDKISFVKLPKPPEAPLPVGPLTVITDDIAFARAK